MINSKETWWRLDNARGFCYHYAVFLGLVSTASLKIENINIVNSQLLILLSSVQLIIY